MALTLELCKDDLSFISTASLHRQEKSFHELGSIMSAYVRAPGRRTRTLRLPSDWELPVEPMLNPPVPAGGPPNGLDSI